MRLGLCAAAAAKCWLSVSLSVCLLSKCMEWPHSLVTTLQSLLNDPLPVTGRRLRHHHTTGLRGRSTARRRRRGRRAVDDDRRPVAVAAHSAARPHRRRHAAGRAPDLRRGVVGASRRPSRVREAILASSVVDADVHLSPSISDAGGRSSISPDRHRFRVLPTSGRRTGVRRPRPVSYTHLTLPTILRV